MSERPEDTIADLEGALDAVRIAHGEKLEAAEAAHISEIAATGERLRSAEESASAAERRFRHLNADIEAAAARRDAVRADLTASANALAG